MTYLFWFPNIQQDLVLDTTAATYPVYLTSGFWGGWCIRDLTPTLVKRLFSVDPQWSSTRYQNKNIDSFLCAERLFSLFYFQHLYVSEQYITIFVLLCSGTFFMSSVIILWSCRGSLTPVILNVDEPKPVNALPGIIKCACEYSAANM